jgi:AcrR family transcriptional regulator
MGSLTRNQNNQQRGERRAEVREALLRSAGKLLNDGVGYTEISVERLIADAGIARATFYVHFEDKGALLRAWLADMLTELDAVIDGWLPLHGHSSRDELRAALARVLHTYRPYARPMAAVFDAAQYDPEVRREIDTLMAANIARLEQHIERGQQEGWIVDSILARETAGWLIWMVERVLHQLTGFSSDEEAELHVDTYADIVWLALYAPAAAR